MSLYFKKVKCSKQPSLRAPSGANKGTLQAGEDFFNTCLEGCLMISQRQYTPLLLGVCLTHAALQSVPNLEKR